MVHFHLWLLSDPHQPFLSNMYHTNIVPLELRPLSITLGDKVAVFSLDAIKAIFSLIRHLNPIKRWQGHTYLPPGTEKALSLDILLPGICLMNCLITGHL